MLSLKWLTFFPNILGNIFLHDKIIYLLVSLSWVNLKLLPSLSVCSQES